MQLNNAIKFTNKGDTINISIKKENNNAIVGIIINIMDKSLGIDSKIFPRLFTKFATNSHAGGTGLGLYLYKCIIEKHNGKI